MRKEGTECRVLGPFEKALVNVMLFCVNVSRWGVVVLW